MIKPPMQYSKVGQALTESFEGCPLEAYLDIVGVPTIAYGHTRGVHLGMTCTKAQADQWLLEDMQEAVDCVNAAVDVVLTQGEFDALVDFVFNLGAPAFLRSTMRKLLNAGKYHEAAAQFGLWDHAGGQVVAGLLRRRLAEEKEFNS